MVSPGGPVRHDGPVPADQPSPPGPALSPLVAAWERRGTYLTLGGRRIFTLDRPAADPSGEPAVLLLHGFPTSSFDYHLVVDALSRTRRVLSLDFLGFGLSDKPDIAYTVDLQADLVMDFLGVVGAEAFALLTHDMGDTVGGELLARHMDGIWPVDVTQRIVTNGSIYIEMAHLTPGQELLLGLPDKLLAPGTVDQATLTGALAATMGPGTRPPAEEMAALWELVAHDRGELLLARLIRYVDERRVRQARYTGAIERHPSPLTVVWGTEDPVAVPAMTTRLAETRPDARVVLLPGVGHYPMLEAPLSIHRVGDQRPHLTPGAPADRRRGRPPRAGSAGRPNLGRGPAHHLVLAGRICQGHVEVDVVPSAFDPGAGHHHPGDQLLSGPRLADEAHRVVGEVAHPHVVGQCGTQKAHRQHAVAEHAGLPGRHGLDLVVVHRVHVPRDPGVADDVGPGQYVSALRSPVTGRQLVEVQFGLPHRPLLALELRT